MSNAAPSTLGTAVITGASSGIGKVYADRLAARGYDLLLVARRADRLKAIAADLQERFPIRVEVLVADLSQPADLAEAVKRISAVPSVSLLVNNAGVSALGTVAQTSPETMANMVALNITALSALTMAVLPEFQERNAGTIVNIGSGVGFSGYPLMPIYGGTKAYVLNFTQALQQQLAGTGVRVQLVTPAAVKSEGWDAFVAALPPSSIDPAIVMSTEDCVDAALSGLDKGELITAPSLQDASLLQNLETASLALIQAAQTGQPASRYGVRS